MSIRGQALPFRQQSHPAWMVCARWRSTFIPSRIGTRLSLSLTESPGGACSGEEQQPESVRTRYLDLEANTRGRLSPSWWSL